MDREWQRPRSAALRTALLPAALALASCATEPAAPAQSAGPPPPRYPIQSFAPEQSSSPLGETPSSPTDRTNDPSASADTPLCGREAREAVAAAVAISPAVMSGGGACTQTACFDPLTDTYIGADGYTHVCQ